MTIDLRDDRAVHFFEHQAMNTIFSLRLACPDRERAARAAAESFRRLDRLEECLSRYRDGSDVSRINALGRGESVFIEEETCVCLKLAMEVWSATGGLFDITLGAQVESRKRDGGADLPELRGRIELAPDRPMVTCIEPGRQLDLGGIGKGFGLDRMADALKEHEVESALLSCAGSTLLALGPGTWPVALQGEAGERALALRGQALSASGTGFQGAHVVRPDNPAHVFSFRRVWVVAGNAAVADALSTACLVMDEQEIRLFRQTSPLAERIFLEPFSPGEIVELPPEADAR